MSWASALPRRSAEIKERLEENHEGPRRLLQKLRGLGFQVFLKDNQLMVSPKVVDPQLRTEIKDNKAGLMALLRNDGTKPDAGWKKDWLAFIGELHVRFGNVPDPEDQVKYGFLMDMYIESFRVVTNERDWIAQKANLKDMERMIKTMGLDIPTLDYLEKEVPF